MSDNFPQTPGSGRNVATDQVTYSGDTADVQLIRPVLVTGTEGAKTVVDLPGDATYGVDVDVTRLPSIPAGSNNIGDVDILSIAAGDNNIGNVDVLTLPSLPAGSNNIGDVDILSIAAGDNNIGNVDIVSVPADPFGANADAASVSGSISAKLREIATSGVILKAGTAGIGKLTANSGVDIGDVDVTSITPGTGATNLGKAEDAAHTTGDVGIMALAVRKDTATALPDADGDYTPLIVNSAGRLHVVPPDDIKVDLNKIAGASAAVSNGTAATALRVTVASDSTGQIAVASIAAGDNNIGNVDVATLPSIPAGSNIIGTIKVVDAAGSNVAQVDASGQQKVVLPTGTVGGATSLPAGSNNIGDVDILSIAAGDNNIGNVDIVTVPADPFGANADAASASGSISAKLREIATNGVILKAGTAGIGKLTSNTGVDIGDVDVLTCGTITPGTGATNLGKAEDAVHNTGDVGVMALAVSNEANTARAADGDYLPIATDTEGNVRMVGNRDHAATDAGEPVKVGFKAETTYQTAVADGQRTDGVADVYGCQFVRPDHPRAWSYHLDTSTAQTDASVQSAPGSGLSVYITDIVFSSGAATAINMFIEEGSTKILGPYYLEAVAGRGFAISFKTPKKCTANTAITLTTSQSIAHTVDITGFIAP